MLSVDVTPPTEVGEQLLDVPLGEGGAVAADGLCSAAPHGRTPVAIVGGTGYVGRLLARPIDDSNAFFVHSIDKIFQLFHV